MSYAIDFNARVLKRVRNAITSLLNGQTDAGTRVYWGAAPDDAAYPNIVFQSQDAGGKAQNYINGNGWEGLITIRVQSTTSTTADTILAAVPALLFAGTTVDGYSFVAKPKQPVPFPIQDLGGTKIYTAAAIFTAQLS